MDHTQPQSPRTNQTKMFGHYQILSILGEGGMGTVYKALDTKLNRVVALKVLLAKERASQEQVKRFILEAQAVAHLKHPNIINVYEISNFNNTHYFTMDFVEGSSLKELIAHKKISFRKGIALFLKVLEAMHYAHQQNIVHRDLKPENIMVDSAGNPYIMDFGLAKVLHRDHGLSKTGMVMGTLRYMSPEQASGKHRQIDARSDIFSLGAILYELASGKRAFQGNSSLVLLAEITQKNPTPPSKINIRIPKEIDAVCKKALHKKKENRYSSAAAMSRDLQQIMSGDTKKKHSKPSLLTFCAIGFLCITVILIGMNLSDTSHNSETNTVAEKNTPKTNESENTQPNHNGVVDKNSQESRVDSAPPQNTLSTPEKEDLPHRWPLKLWNVCWNGSYVDFSLRQWDKLTNDDQASLAHEYQIWYAKHHKHSVEKEHRISATLSIKMVLIPPGKIWLGELAHKPSERYLATVDKPFWMAKYETSQQVWKQVMGEIPAKTHPRYVGDDLPVVRINFDDAKLFCEKANLEIPDEVRWEYATRGGTTGYFYWGKIKGINAWRPNMSNDISHWYGQPISTASHRQKLGLEHEKFLQTSLLKATDSFTPNPFRLHNVLANAHEFCQGVWRAKHPVLRGGGAYSYIYEARVLDLWPIPKSTTSTYTSGFRAMKSVK